MEDVCDVVHVLLLEKAESADALEEWLNAAPLAEVDPDMAELKTVLGVG